MESYIIKPIIPKSMMSNLVYYHSETPGIEAKLIPFFMGLFGMKRQMEKGIVNNRFKKEPATLPTSFFKKFNVEKEEYLGRKVYTISPKQSETNCVILFLHGGAYYANITPMHWRLAEQLIMSTNATFVVPDYPLAPESTCRDTYRFLDVVYDAIVSGHPSRQTVFMGDSAGGGLALGFAMHIRNEGKYQPEQIFLFSPWLDASMTNPEIAKMDKQDKILSLHGLKVAGRKYAGDLDVTDFRVSPLYGDFSHLGRISVFIGTNDLLIADVRKFKQMMEEQHIGIHYFEYPGMFHDWVIVPRLKETKDVISKITEHLKTNWI